MLFVGSTFLSFSNRFSLGSGLSDVGLSLIFALFLVGLIQSGFNGSGLPVRSADVDYVFTSPVPPREVFAAKVLMNSFTTVLLSFPPILALFFKFSLSYGTSLLDVVLGGLGDTRLPGDGAPPQRRHHALTGVQHSAPGSGCSGTHWSSSWSRSAWSRSPSSSPGPLPSWER